jgi:imidazole glycerol-phosphate synthase subunit HisH
MVLHPVIILELLEAPTMHRITVIDYEMGNLHSACKGLQNAGAYYNVATTGAEIDQAEALLLPGVGSFDPAIQSLRARDLEAPIKAAIAAGKPFLGICLGLQLLFDGSEEGVEPGLGVIPGWCRRFQPEPYFAVPHMGWNQLDLTQPDNPLWFDTPTGTWMYFVHSYYVDPVEPGVIAATTTHGKETVTAAIARGNLWAVQFHPEKSSVAGLQLLENFVRLVEERGRSALLV